MEDDVEFPTMKCHMMLETHRNQVVLGILAALRAKLSPMMYLNVLSRAADLTLVPVALEDTLPDTLSTHRRRSRTGAVDAYPPA